MGEDRKITMPPSGKDSGYRSPRDKFLGLSLESTRKSYYPQLQAQLKTARENEKRLQLLVDNMPARISYVDTAQRYVSANREYEIAFGLKREQIVGRRVETIVGTGNYHHIKGQIQDALGGKHVRFEMPFTDSKGDTHWSEVSYVPDIGPGAVVRGFYVLALDLTEKKRAEEEKKSLEHKLRQAQKMESLGTLAGGIAHDFNNLLMGIQGRVSLLSLDLDPADPAFEHIAALEEYVRSATNLTKQLLGLARGGKYEVKAIDINELVLNSATLFGRTKKEIAIHARLAQAALVVEADRRQIEQVLLNIYINAWQAMPDGGTLYLATAAATLDDTVRESYGLECGPYVKISVTDSGIGMDEDTRQRVFDPFFTTKEKTRGTGLGLASAYGIIKNHKGVITVYSEVGHGSTFNIYLPLSGKKVDREVPLANRLVKGTETVLLVDDEPMVIDVCRHLLEKLGYRVLAAESGQEALDAVRRMPGDIDLVILDMIMPDMDGGNTFDRLREVRPQIPVILSSGYAINGQATKIMERGCNGFIQKPFNISELSVKLRTVLDAAKPG